MIEQYIGIDPDCEASGIAIIYVCKNHTIECLSMSFPKLLDFIFFHYNSTETKITIEAGWLNKKSNFRPNFGKKVSSDSSYKDIKDSYESSQRISDRISAKVGANHETGKKLVEMLEYKGYKVDLIKPLPKRWKGTGGKITNEELNEILKRNGFDELKRTNQDVRDSVLIALASYGKM